jgi:uncharacterized protein (DUF1501 family)
MSDQNESRPAAYDSADVEALKCADCARSDSLAPNLRPSTMLPIPADALAGFPDGVPHATRTARGLNRRSFMRNGLIGMASVYSATRLDWGSIWESAIAQADGPMQKSIVCIYLNGGNDGLNAIVPIDAPNFSVYNAQRANIARVLGPSIAGQVGTTVMGGTGATLGFANPLVSGTGNNGDTKGFDTLYGDGSGGVGSDLAVFPAADYTPPNLSHFESRDYWFAGALQELETGWLGRWLDTYGSQTNPLQAVSLDSSLSKQIRSNTAPVCAIEDLQGASFTVPNVTVAQPNAEVANLAAVPAGAGNIGLARARSIYGLTVDVSNRLAGLGAVTQGPGYPANSDLSRKLQLAATLLGANLGTRIVTIDWGSFDTHGGQVTSQDPQFAVLSSALAAFKADLAARNIEQNVITLVFSEFGRRVMSNDSLGTDHGAGGMMLVSGSSVKGGLAGEHPGLTTLDQDGDLIVKTDFRTVYQAIISEWLQTDPGPILPGGPFAGVQRYDGGTTLLK